MKSDGILLAARRNKFFQPKGRKRGRARRVSAPGFFASEFEAGGFFPFLARRIYYHLELMPARK